MRKRLLTLPIFIAICLLGLYFRPHLTVSAPPTSVKDTLSSSQLSYFARLGVGNTAGNSRITIATTGNPSNTTANLFVGDTISIGTTNSSVLATYTVKDVGNTATIEISPNLGSTSAYNSLLVVATRSAIHTITFTPQSNITGGAWQFLIKATSRTGELPNDGIPDQQGFDIGATIPSGPTNGSGTRLRSADITCPFGLGTTVAPSSIGTTAIIGSNVYHVFTCQLGAGETNPVGVGSSMVIGRDLATGSQLINPSAALNHTPGQADSTADIYSFYIRHLDASAQSVDSDTIQGKIAVVEAVRVTATVDPTLSFYIDNVGTTQNNIICGNTLPAAANNTTATAVNYGSLTLGQFNDLAQRLSCVTNASSGYAVTVYEASTMHNIQNTGITIPDTNCDANGCGLGTTAAWVTDIGATNSEWGYSIQNISATTVPFTYTTGGSLFTATAFGVGSSNARTVMSNSSTPATTERIYMCYRLTISTFQTVGNYENELIYTATAQF